MTPVPPPPRASGTPERPAQPPFRELSRTFWRGVSSTHGLGPAIQGVLNEFSSHVGAQRASVWLHDRRARELALFASSDPVYGAAARRISITDPKMPAALGLRLERAQILGNGPQGHDPVVVMPLRGWRRALGTLVIEGTESAVVTRTDDQQWLDLANELGRQLSVGIENVQLLEDMLRQRRLLEDTFNSLVDPVIVTDRLLRVVQMNDACAMRLGRSRSELLERSLSELVGADLAEWVARADASAEVEGDTGVRTQTMEHAELGGMFAVTVTPLINEDGEPVGNVVVARDITVQMRLEADREALRTRLAQSEKLAALGQFVAGIAHEINNPLQGVLGHLELMLTAYRVPGLKKTNAAAALPRAVRKDLRLIYHEADRAAKIVRSLLTFTGSQRKTPRRLRIDRVVTRALASRRAAMTRAGIALIRQQGEHLPPVIGDPLALHQALVNVLMNAEQAIASTGPNGSISIATASPDPSQVTITIRDTGPGIPLDVLPRIFDPFFTTKEVGQGTGLGLAIAYGVIQEHGGTIQASNAPGGGAVFTIAFEAAGPDAEQPANG
jgi:two-component system, NtrC family, sensor kinase